MEIFYFLRSKIGMGLGLAVIIVGAVSALMWPALAIVLMIGLLAVGAITACVFAVYELGLMAFQSRHQAPPPEEPAYTVTMAPDTESVHLPTEHR